MIMINMLRGDGNGLMSSGDSQNKHDAQILHTIPILDREIFIPPQTKYEWGYIGVIAWVGPSGKLFAL